MAGPLNSNIEETNNNYPNTAKIVTLLIESASNGIRITALSGASYAVLIWTTNGNVVFTNRQGGTIRPVITELSGSLAAKSADQDDTNKANVFLRPAVCSYGFAPKRVAVVAFAKTVLLFSF